MDAIAIDAAVSLLHHHGIRQGVAHLRASSQYPEQAIALVLGTYIPHA